MIDDSSWILVAFYPIYFCTINNWVYIVFLNSKIIYYFFGLFDIQIQKITFTPFPPQIAQFMF